MDGRAVMVQRATALVASFNTHQAEFPNAGMASTAMHGAVHTCTQELAIAGIRQEERLGSDRTLRVRTRKSKTPGTARVPPANRKSWYK